MLALVSRLIVVDNGTVVADGPRDKVLKTLREQAGARAADVGKTEKVHNIVIPRQQTVTTMLNKEEQTSTTAQSGAKSSGSSSKPSAPKTGKKETAK